MVLVACCKRKLAHPAPARDLYTSTWFRLARRYAEQQAAQWFILSARHGLVRPDTVLEPYECALPTLSPAERRCWASGVLGALQPHLTEETPLQQLGNADADFHRADVLAVSAPTVSEAGTAGSGAALWAGGGGAGAGPHPRRARQLEKAAPPRSNPSLSRSRTRRKDASDTSSSGQNDGSAATSE